MRNILPYSKTVLRPFKGRPLEVKTIGDHIRKKRLECERTQKQVAEQIGVSEDVVTMWENNKASPFVHHYPNIIAFLGYYPFMEDTETLGGTLLMSRRMHGLRAEELGKWLGVHGTTIRSWEKNLTVPSEQMLILYYEFDREHTKPLA